MDLASIHSEMTQKDTGIPLKIDGMPRTARPGMTILDVAREAGISIPTLCHLRGLPPLATCRICLVEEMTRSVLLPACATSERTPKGSPEPGAR
jgi:NADH dehydrogenase/NADH:ubiquinone oxidoreductase subunit G